VLVQLQASGSGMTAQSMRVLWRAADSTGLADFCMLMEIFMKVFEKTARLMGMENFSTLMVTAMMAIGKILDQAAWASTTGRTGLVTLRFS
jgi:hypothetical protein